MARSPEATPDARQTRILDPIEPLNRGLFGVDKGVSRILGGRGRLLFTARWIPARLREALYNAFDNLDEPETFANDMLQRKVHRAGVSVARFGINTTVGVIGVFDVASRIGLRRQREDFGQTLGFYGVTPGPYIYVPIAGPTTVRDTLAGFVDGLFSPLGWIELSEIERRSIQVTKGFTQPATINIRQIARGAADEGETSDEYATLRQLYYDQRAAQIADLPNLADNPIVIDPKDYVIPKVVPRPAPTSSLPDLAPRADADPQAEAPAAGEAASPATGAAP
jgi:phospholipid-binding lipoprotein MlaA